MGRTGYQAMNPSYWPILTAVSVLGVFKSVLMCVSNSGSVVFWWIFLSSFVLLFYSLYRWSWDIVVESQHKGEWTSYEVRLQSWGFRFFIISEIFFFAGLLISYIYFGVGEMSIHGVGFWPPRGVKPLDPSKGALMCTGLLVWSSLSVSWAFKAVKMHNKVYIEVGENSVGLKKFMKAFFKLKGVDSKEKESILRVCVAAVLRNFKSAWVTRRYLLEAVLAYTFTILAGGYFSFLQVKEYFWASFTMGDGVFGSIFYLVTGFHGLHVIAGNIFLFVTVCRLCFLHFSYKNFYVGVWASAWYWHLVDAVWVFVYSLVYLWGYWGG